MLGQAVVRVAAADEHDVLALGREELDATDGDAVLERTEAERPDVVIHCAGYTDVDAAESDVHGAMAGNARSARAVAEGAAATGATVVYPSTDYVFDGHKQAPYLESDPTGPLSVYGESKLSGEREVAAATSRHVIARSSWLFGRGGRNFVDTMLRLSAEQGEVAVVTDQVGCPTNTEHLARGLLRLAEGEAFGVHHLSASGECSWHDFAVAIFERAEVPCVVREKTSAAMERPAPRPAYSVLVSERPDAVLLSPWMDGLTDYLAERTVHA